MITGLGSMWDRPTISSICNAKYPGHTGTTGHEHIEAGSLRGS
jgi:hypothetical protein